MGAVHALNWRPNRGVVTAAQAQHHSRPAHHAERPSSSRPGVRRLWKKLPWRVHDDIKTPTPENRGLHDGYSALTMSL
jgi:hypothetical protein